MVSATFLRAFPGARIKVAYEISNSGLGNVRFSERVTFT
jgi:hypothetical protein